MGIIQENRFDAPQPEVTKTEYGAEYVTAATERPVDNEEPEKDAAPAEEAVQEEPQPAPAEEAVQEEPQPAPVEAEEPQPKKEAKKPVAKKKAVAKKKVARPKKK